MSPKLSIHLINSPEFKENEAKARYSKDTCCKFVEDYFKDKIAKKEQIAKSDLDLSKDEQAFMKLGFTYADCYNIFLNFLAHPSELEKCSVNLKKDVRKYIRNPS